MSNDVTANINHGNGEKTLVSYVVGFVLSLILTLAAFIIVEKHMYPAKTLYIAVSVLAIVQLLVQVICFMRLNTKQEGRWNLIAFLFTIFVIIILVSGSLWIMYNLNYYMVH